MTIHVDSRAVALTATPAVYTRGGIAYASSRDVAAFFGKDHKHVLRDIRQIVEDAPMAGSNFGPCTYRAVTGGREYPAVEMTRDGFTLLAMGFTGKTALAFKVRYIEEFNRMEAQLKARVRAVPLPNVEPPTALLVRVCLRRMPTAGFA